MPEDKYVEGVFPLRLKPGALEKDSPTETKRRKIETRNARNESERKNKSQVRKRDGGCRFPLCGCRRLELAIEAREEVSHDRHKGMGGDPTGDRSLASGMLMLCMHRHQTGVCSRHKQTLRSEALDLVRGNDGPIAWYVHRDVIARLDLSALPSAARHALRPQVMPEWIQVGRENGRPQEWDLTVYQRVILTELAHMKL